MHYLLDPRPPVTSGISLSAAQWLSPLESSVFPAEIWAMIGKHVLSDLIEEDRLDRIARPYSVPPKGPQLIRNEAGGVVDDFHISPWHIKSQTDRQKRWRPLRLCRTIKPLRECIDTYFQRHWIQGAAFWIARTGEHGEDWGGWWVSMFEEFRGQQSEIAVFRGSFLAGKGFPGGCDTDPDKDSNVEMAECIEDLNDYEPGYHPRVFMRIEDGLTDMLPTDLEYPTKENGFRFLFHWRPYIELIASQQRGHHEDNLVECVAVRWAQDPDFDRKAIGGEQWIRMKLLTSGIERAEMIGCDGRSVETRRQRRWELGVQHDMISKGDNAIAKQRYICPDEQDVARRLLDVTVEYGLDLKW